MKGKLGNAAEAVVEWSPVIRRAVEAITRLAQRIRRRRSGEPETHGDEGGHPAVYPLDATRQEIRKRREQQP